MKIYSNFFYSKQLFKEILISTNSRIDKIERIVKAIILIIPAMLKDVYFILKGRVELKKTNKNIERTFFQNYGVAISGVLLTVISLTSYYYFYSSEQIKAIPLPVSSIEANIEQIKAIPLPVSSIEANIEQIKAIPLPVSKPSDLFVLNDLKEKTYKKFLDNLNSLPLERKFFLPEIDHFDIIELEKINEIIEKVFKFAVIKNGFLKESTFVDQLRFWFVDKMDMFLKFERFVPPKIKKRWAYSIYVGHYLYEEYQGTNYVQ
jgi:hypothetical protein